MTSRFLLWIAVSVFLIPVLGAVLHAKIQTGFLDRIVRIGGETYRYQVYVPSEWSKSRKWPVVLFLHGAGERGQDGLAQTQVGIAAAIRQHPNRFPCIVVMPQCRSKIWWPEPAMETMALRALDQSMNEFKGDPQRTYLTGLSMGGYGSWSLASKNPGKFAAVAVICGGVRRPSRVPGSVPAVADAVADPYAEVAGKIGKTPVWIFHGGADRTVPVTESRQMNEALKASGGNVRYTEYEGIGHNSWDRAYGEPEFMTWLLAQRLAR